MYFTGIPDVVDVLDKILFDNSTLSCSALKYEICLEELGFKQY